MRPKDLVIDIFGDYVRYSGGGIRLVHLVEILSLFDVEASTLRVTLSRMRRDGWLESSRRGREATYYATRKLTDVLDKGYERIFGPRSVPWSGQWTMVLYRIPESQRLAREKLKRALGWEGFGQLNPTTWVSPHDLRERMHDELGAEDSSDIHVVTMSTGSLARDRNLAHQCWALEDISAQYQKFIDTWHPIMVNGSEIEGAEALRLRIELVWEYRRFPLIDPGLPSALLPEGWLGGHAHELFLQTHRSLSQEANGYFFSLVQDGVYQGS